jgi:predicted DNA binding CopG/RHH family protein
MDKKKLEELTADAELWDSRQLGASAEHMKVVSDEEQKDIEDSLGLQMISIRLSKTLIEQLKELARLEGIGYQPLIRTILTQFAEDNKHKLDSLLSAPRAAEKAEKLFTQAIKYKEMIPTLAPLSNERIRVEFDYSTALTSANKLFCQACEKCSDPVLKRHIKLRLEEIDALCQQELQALHDKKFGKAV